MKDEVDNQFSSSSIIFSILWSNQLQTIKFVKNYSSTWAAETIEEVSASLV